MSNKPKKWPDYALNCWEGTVHNLKCIDDTARQVQELLAKGEQMQAFISLSDIRNLSVDARSLMHQARNGDYE
jgi:hypothetical protein